MKKASTHTILLSAFFVVVFGALFFMFSQLKQENQLTGAQVVEFSPSVVTISGVSPTSVYQGAAIQLNITGIDFNSSAVLSIPNVTVLSTIIVSDIYIEANISVPIAAGDGLYDVTITQDNESSTLPGGLTILEGPFDISTLTNVTPADGYINNSPGLNVVNLTYNISTAFGVDASLVSIVGGYIEIENLNTSNDSYLTLANWSNVGGIFTLQFEEHTYDDDGDHFGEIYVNVSVDGDIVEREYYTYFGVGAPTCTLLPTCAVVGTVGVLTTYVINISTATLPITGCAFLTAVAGCSVAPGPGAACTISCTAPAAGVFAAGLVANDSSSFCVPFPFAGGLPCTFTFTDPPPPPSGGGSGGGTNSYPGGAICPLYCKDPKYSHVAICQNYPCAALAVEQPSQTTQPVAAPPAPQPVVQSKPVPQPVLQEKAVEVSLPPQEAPVQEMKMPPLPQPVEESSSSSTALVVVVLLAIVAGLVYWQFFYKHKR